MIVGGLGIEPRFTPPKGAVLPLDDPPIQSRRRKYSITQAITPAIEAATLKRTAPDTQRMVRWVPSALAAEIAAELGRDLIARSGVALERCAREVPASRVVHPDLGAAREGGVPVEGCADARDQHVLLDGGRALDRDDNALVATHRLVAAPPVGVDLEAELVQLVPELVEPALAVGKDPCEQNLASVHRHGAPPACGFLARSSILRLVRPGLARQLYPAAVCKKNTSR